MSCGTCTMCCKLMGVEELPKPSYKWCSHCDKGCSIYPDRPKSCREFECAYLQNADKLPLSARPDKSKCVITATDDGLLMVMVDQGYPDAWRKQPTLGMILACLPTHKRAIIVFGEGRRKLIVEQGKMPGSITQREIIMSKPDAKGEQVWIEE